MKWTNVDVSENVGAISLKLSRALTKFIIFATYATAILKDSNPRNVSYSN